jgi:hypothetical protein
MMMTRILAGVGGICPGGRCTGVIGTQRATDHRDGRATGDDCDYQ